MLVIFVLNVVVLAIGGIFVWLPEVTTLPEVLGFDIDAALVTGMQSGNRFFELIWPLGYVMQGAIVIVIYYAVKMGLRLIFGHRAPH